jgi:hypothetical protein
VVSLFKGKSTPRKFPHSVEIIGLLTKGIVYEAQECGGAGYEIVADAKTMGRLEKSTLETPVPAKCAVKVCPPKGIVKVAIDGRCYSW